MTVTKESLVTSKDKSLRVCAVLSVWRLIDLKKTLYAWTEQVDSYGKLYLLDDNLGDGVPAFTVAELINLLPPMGTFAFLLFCYRTRLQPDAVADYIIAKL
jgi:hypothetical protein